MATEQTGTEDELNYSPDFDDQGLADLSDEDFAKLDNPAEFLGLNQDDSDVDTDVNDSEDKEELDDDGTTEDEDNNDGTDDKADTDSDDDTTDDSDEKSGEEATDTEDDADADSTDSSDEDKEKDKEALDAEAQLKELFAPFKANGREMKVDNIEEARTLMAMGANYNKKMAGIKPNMKYLRMLENNGLLDEDKLTYLIDLDKKNPEAIKKLVKDSDINPLDIDTKEDPNYQPGTYKVDDSQIALEQALDSIKDSSSFQTTLDVVTNKWDKDSQDFLANNPNDIVSLNTQIENGVYDIIMDSVEKERALGRLMGLSDMDAYKQVGQMLLQRQQGKQPNVVTEDDDKTTNKQTEDKSKRSKKRKAAGTSRSKPAAKEKLNVNPLSLSDEEIENMTLDKFV